MEGVLRPSTTVKARYGRNVRVMTVTRPTRTEGASKRSASMYSLDLSLFTSLDHLQSAHSSLRVPCSWPTRHSPVAEFTALLYRLWAWGGDGGEVYPVQASDRRVIRPVHAVRHAYYVDRHLGADVLPDAARWTTTHAADRHARNGGPGAEAAGVACSQVLDNSRLGGDFLAAVDTLHAADARQYFQ